MNKIFEVIKENPLFRGISSGELDKLLTCMEAKTLRYKKDELILMAGDSINFVGLILTGGVRIIKESADGNATILTELNAPELFAEVFACAGIDRSPVTVQACCKSEIMLVNYRKIVNSCVNSCGFHSQLIENMLKLLAKKNLMLNQKLEILSKRSTRERLFMLFNMHKGNDTKFTVPFSREEMARYLCVDRSALSKELCNMRDEGLIRFNRNEFEIIK